VACMAIFLGIVKFSVQVYLTYMCLLWAAKLATYANCVVSFYLATETLFHTGGSTRTKTNLSV